MKTRRLLAAVAVILSTGISLLGQDSPNMEQGIKPYGSYHGGDLDSVNLLNGNLTLHIPLISYPQRGDLKISF